MKITVNDGVLNQLALQADGSMLEYAEEEVVKIPDPPGNEVFEWCSEREIEADLLWAGYSLNEYKSAWGIKNEQHRMMFALKWQ
jgi:hypothetical protein